MRHGPKLSTQTVRHYRNQEYEQNLILADQNKIPENCSRGIRVSTIGVEQWQQPLPTPTGNGLKKLGEFGRERTVGIWGKCGKSEDGEGVGVNGDEVERNGRK